MPVDRCIRFSLEQVRLVQKELVFQLIMMYQYSLSNNSLQENRSSNFDRILFDSPLDDSWNIDID